MTKLNAFIALGIFSAYTFASTQPPSTNPQSPSPPSYFNGPYVSLGIGGVQSSLKEAPVFTNDMNLGGGFTLNINFKEKNTRSARSLMARIDVGYNKLLLPNFYLGIETGLKLSSLKSTFLQSSTTTSPSALISQLEDTANIKSKVSHLLHLKPGFLLDPNTSCYGIIGTTITKFIVTRSNYFHLNLGGGNTLVGGNTKKSTIYASNLDLGLGMQSYLSNNTSLAFEYVYHYSLRNLESSVSSEMTQSGTVPVGPMETKRKIQVRSHSVCIKTAYHF